MNDIDRMLVKQFLLRARQEGYSLIENPPRSLDGINIDIYRNKTKICTFDDRHLGEKCSLQVRTDDSTREEIKADFYKLFYKFIHLRDLYFLYADAEPLQGYDHSLGFRAIQQYNNWTLAVKSYSRTGELEFGTFLTGRNNNGYSNSKTILHNVYFDMECYPLAKLDFVARSGLLSKEQLITPDNIKYLRGSCEKTMEREGSLFNEDTKSALGKIIVDLEKAEDTFCEIKYRTEPMSAKIPQYIESKILTVKGIFTQHQIDRSTLPKGLSAYDIQYSSDEMKPDKLWRSVLGHRFGTLITKSPLPIGENGYTELQDKDFSLNPEKHYTLKEFQAKNKDAR